MHLKSGLAAFALALGLIGPLPAVADTLPSWADGANRAAVLAFVTGATTEGSDSYLPPEDRIAVFDNDGTLWTEKPTYTEVIFVFDQIAAMAPDHPEWATTAPYSVILQKGLGALKEIGLKGAVQALTTVYSELNDAELQARARAFLARPHLTAGRAYADVTYAPMTELVDYLRANGFEIYIVSGGTNAFMRSFAEQAYGVPPQNIIGSALALEVVENAEGVAVRRAPRLAYFNDGETKVVNIAREIGVRPAIVVGNSDGDLPMIRYALSGDGPHLALLVRHDDAAREAAYDRGAGDAIAAATPEGDNFLLVSMKTDFAAIWSD